MVIVFGDEIVNCFERDRKPHKAIVRHRDQEQVVKLTYEYGKPLGGMSLGDQRLFSCDDSNWESSWKPLEPEASATLWRYMSLAKFCSLLERRALFFSLVGDMADRYEGFIYPPPQRDSGNRLEEAERLARDVLQKIARSCLISCWTESEYESSLMWEAYAGSEGVAIRTTFDDLRQSILSVGELPITFGQVEYVDYRQEEVSRFGWGPLFHKRKEYRSEDEVRAVLHVPLNRELVIDSDIPLDPDVAEQRGRHIPVNLDILVKEVFVPPHAAPWFIRVVETVVRQLSANARVRPSAI